MKIYIGADHAGFALKEALKKFLKEKGHEVIDKGAFELNPEDDYPDFIEPVAEAVSKDPENSRGIVIGGSGQGEAIDANRFKGVRAEVYYGGSPDSGLETVKLAREDNNANVLSLAAMLISEDEAKKAVEIFLSTSFEGGRHQRRDGCSVAPLRLASMVFACRSPGLMSARLAGMPLRKRWSAS